MKQGFFITGTDTGVGKTLVASALVHGCAARGWLAAGMKPVAAGCRREGGRLVSEDVEQLRAAGNVDLPWEIVNPYAFEPPLAPHVAAEMAGIAIDLGVIREAFGKVAAAADRVIVEGVGGFRVPLNAAEDTADLAAALGLPLILVVGMRLGCLNHALLTLEAMAARRLELAGWVASCIDPAMLAPEENLAALRARIAAPCLGVLPYQARPDAAAAAELLFRGETLKLLCG